MRKYQMLFASIVLLMALLANCAPREGPTLSTPVPSVPPQVSVPTANPTTPSAQDAAWAKVVEAAEKEGTFTFYASSSFNPVQEPVIKAFEARYGIKVDVLGGRGAQWLERLRTEKRMGQIVGDITEGASANTESMRQAGLLASSADLPVLHEQGVWLQEPWGLDPERMYLKYVSFYTGPDINTKLVPPQEVSKLKSWHDFLDPEWKGRMSLNDPVLGVSSNYFIMFLRMGLLDSNFMQQLGKQDIKFAISPDEDATKLARGEVAVNLMGYTAAISKLVVAGAPIKVLDMKEGVVSEALVIAAINNSPHPNAAKVFLNWILSPEGQTAISKAFLSSPIRKGVVNFTPESLKIEAHNPIEITPERNQWISDAFRGQTVTPFLKPR